MRGMGKTGRGSRTRASERNERRPTEGARERPATGPVTSGTDRRRRLLLAAVVAAVVVPAALLLVTHGRGRNTPLSVPAFPNAPVILISIDTMRSDRLPAYGYRGIETPNLDRFQRDAWLFERAYSPCPMTLPAHSTLLTGLLPPEHGVRNNLGFVFDGKTHASLPRMLKEHGYATGAAVSTYVLRRETGLGELFDFYEDSTEPLYETSDMQDRRTGDKTVAIASQWIRKQTASPFFFFLHIFEPHYPYRPPEPFASRYGRTYDGAVASADAIVGTFLDELRSLGVYDRAVVVLVGDHGEGLGDHVEAQHSILLYREAIQVPLLLKLPGSLGAGRRVAPPAQLSDVLPTVTALLGIDTPALSSGLSLVGLTEKTAESRAIYSETLYPRLQLAWSDLRSVIDARYHYIHSPRPELYDLLADPAERHDLITAEPATAQRLAQELSHFPEGNQQPTPVDAETLKRLAALGYIGGVHTGEASSSLPNPADNLKYVKRMHAAWELADNGRLPAARAALRSILDENPSLVVVWSRLGNVELAMGRAEDAAAAFREALQRSPIALPDVCLTLGYTELLLKRLDEAETTTRLALEEEPVKAHALLARIAAVRRDFPAALEHARAAVAGQYGVPANMLILAETHLWCGAPVEALEVLDAARARAAELELAPIPRLELLRGEALTRLRRMPEAEEAFNRELAAFPASLEARGGLAIVLGARGDLAGADRVIEELVRAHPGRLACTIAAKVYQTLRQPEKAAEWQRRAAAAGSGTPSR